MPQNRLFRGRMKPRSIICVVAISSLFVGGFSSPAHAAPPSNDEFESAVVIDSVPFSQSMAVDEATVGVDDPGCPSGHRTVWYRFTPPANIAVDVNTQGSNFSASIGVYTGTRGSLSQVACGSRLRLSLTENVTYHFMITSSDLGQRAALTFNLVPPPPPPAIDSRANARTITRLPFTQSVDTRETTVEAGETLCEGGTHTVWFSYKSARGRKLRATTHRSDYDTTMGVYQRTASGLKQIACADNSRTSSFARQRFTAKPRKTYLFQVGSASGFGGILRFRLEAPPPVLRGRVHLERIGRVNTVTGIARISFTARCTRENTFVGISGELRQRFRHRRVVRGSLSDSTECGRKPKTFNVRVDGGERPFVPGLAGVRFKVRVSHGDDDVAVSKSGPVRLKGCKCNW